MAETTIKPILSLCATTADKLPDIAIKNAQLIFVQDKHKIAFDFNGIRKFYNQIEEINTESDRLAVTQPVTGLFYFVIETAVLWTYQEDWIQITSSPKEVIFIGTEIPELGSANKLYVNTTVKEISVWDDNLKQYIIVADKISEISEVEIASLFL